MMNLYKGSIVKSKTDSAIFPKGMVGVVFDTYSGGVQIIFENGEYSGFSKDEYDTFLLKCGYFSKEIERYVFTNVIKLSDDFRKGVFSSAFKI